MFQKMSQTSFLTAAMRVPSVAPMLSRWSQLNMYVQLCSRGASPVTAHLQLKCRGTAGADRGRLFSLISR
jgi:hypothetical protein